MKKILFLTVLLFAVAVAVSAQNIYPVDNEKQADVKLFVVNNEKQADLCIYDVNNEYQTDREAGKWHFVCCANDAEKKVYFVDNVYKADLKVFFVSNENQAGWKNKTKDYLLK